MRPTKEKSKQTDKGFDFERIWELLGEESPASVDHGDESHTEENGPNRGRESEEQAHDPRSEVSGETP